MHAPSMHVDAVLISLVTMGYQQRCNSTIDFTLEINAYVLRVSVIMY